MSSSDSLDVDDGGLNTNTNSAADVGSTSEIEDIIWTLLARSGLISQFKGEIAKCLQENSGTILSDSAKVQTRADPEILRSIYEYLQWTGMKQTSAFLLSESAVRFDVTTTEENGVPNLCRLFKKADSADASLSFDDQFASPLPAQRSELPSMSLGNRTYTAGPAPLQADETMRSEIPSFLNSRQNASTSLTRSSMYFTPDTGSPTYVGSKDDTAGELGVGGGSRREKDEETAQIVRLPEPNSGVQPAKLNSGNGDFHKLQEQMKTLTFSVDRQEAKEEESNISLRSLQSEPVDSPPPYPDQGPSRLISYNVTASDGSVSQDHPREENENIGDSTSKSPTFLSPSSSVEEENAESRDRDSRAAKSQSQHQGSNEEVEGRSEQRRATKEKEEDTLDESMSMSELQCSLPDNNTQDVSLAGATSDTDSKELDSCDHVVKL